MDGKFVGVFFLLLERIFQFRQSFHSFIFKPVSHISFAKQVRIEPGGSHTSGTDTGAFQCVTADSGIHRADIEKWRFFGGGNISRKENGKHFFRPVIYRITA